MADVPVVPVPNEIERGAASRRLDITCNVAPGRDPGSGAAGVEAKRALSYEQGYHPESLGEFAARQASTRSFYGPGLLALLGIVPVIYSDFASLRLTRLVAFTLPSALVVHLTGGIPSLGSLVGFVRVLGIAARNGIVLVSRYRHLEDEEGEPLSEGLVRAGPEVCLVLTLMTALATGLASLPLIVSGLKPGYEVEYPLAVVTLGGLPTFTLLNPFLPPPLDPRFVRRPLGEVAASA